MTIDGHGWCLIFLVCGITFAIGMVVGYFTVKIDEKAFKEYLADREQTKKAIIKEVKRYVRQLTVYELERWLNEKL